MNNSATHPARQAVVKVGDGRGFVMEIPNPFRGHHGTRRVIVTVGRCLPNFPHPFPSSHEQKTFQSLLGSLTDTAPSIAAECIFVDPITDMVVLGAPNKEKLSYDWKNFQILTQNAKTLFLGNFPQKEKVERGWLLSLDGQWRPCKVTAFVYGLARPSFYITEAAGGISGEMSGSPILLDDGKAIGALSTTLNNSEGTVCKHTIESRPQPSLKHCLPAWLLRGPETAEVVRN